MHKMVKIKGWTKIWDAYRYENPELTDTDFTSYTVARWDNDYEHMCVDISITDEGSFIPVVRHSAGDFPISCPCSMTKAREIAAIWMRRHSKGFIPMQFRENDAESTLNEQTLLEYPVFDEPVIEDKFEQEFQPAIEYPESEFLPMRRKSSINSFVSSDCEGLRGFTPNLLGHQKGRKREVTKKAEDFCGGYGYQGPRTREVNEIIGGFMKTPSQPKQVSSFFAMPKSNGESWASRMRRQGFF
jgi:hypothetical protein